MDSEAEQQLRARIEEQDRAIEKLTQDNAAAEERRKKEFDELVARVSQLSSGEQAAQSESGAGGGAVSTAGRDAVPNSSAEPVDEEEDQMSHTGGDGVPAEADPQDQLGGRGQARGYAPLGESSVTLGARRPAGIKMTVPKLEKGKFDSFAQKMLVYARVHGFAEVFTDAQYVNVGGETREALLSQGVTPSQYEKQLAAWAFLSEALITKVDQAKFYMGTSPRQVWEEIVEWYGLETNEEKRLCSLEITTFKVDRNKSVVEELFRIEELHAKLTSSNVAMDSDTVYSSFVAGLPLPEYELEVRDIDKMHGYDRKEILRLISSRYERLKKSKGKPGPHALACEGVSGRRGGRGRGGKGRGGKRTGGGKGKDGDSGTGKGLESVTCFNCHEKGHYQYDCKVKICERCGGRGHDESKCGTPALNAMMAVQQPSWPNCSSDGTNSDEDGVGL